MKGLKLIGIIFLIVLLVSGYELGLYITTDFIMDNAHQGIPPIYVFVIFIYINLIVGVVLNELAKLGKGLIK